LIINYLCLNLVTLKTGGRGVLYFCKFCVNDCNGYRPICA